MTQKNRIITELGYEVNKRGLDEAIQSQDKIRDAAKKTAITVELQGRAYVELNRDANLSKIAQEINKARTEGSTFNDVLELAGNKLADLGASRAEILKVADALKLSAQEADALATRTRSIALDDEFNRVSRDVGAAGNVQSNLGAGQALLDQAGLGGASQAIGVTGELVVLVEELPRLKESLGALPEAAKSARDAIGVRGAGLIGATLLLAAAYKLASDQYSRQKSEFDAILDRQREYFTIVQEGTTESITTERDAAQNRLDAARQALDAVKSQEALYFEQRAQQVGDFGARFSELGTVLNLGDAGAAALNDQIRELEQETADAEAQLGVLDRALESSEVAANDLTQAIELQQEAQKELAEQIAQDVSRARNQRFEQDEIVFEAAQGDSIEDLNKQIADLGRNANRAASYIAEIEKSGDTSAAAQADLAHYNEEMNYSAELASRLRQEALGQVAANEAQLKSAEALEEEARRREEINTLMIESIRQRNEAEAEAVRMAQTASAEEVTARQTAIDTRRDNIQSEIAQLRGLAEESEVVRSRIAELQTEFTELGNESARIRDLVEPAVIERSIAEAQADIAEIAAWAQAEVDKIRAEATQKIAQATQKRDADIRAATNRAHEAELKAARETNNKLKQIDRDFAQERRRIRERANATESVALANRDALSAFLARRQRDTELRDARRQRDQDRRETQRAYKEQRDEIKRQLQRQWFDIQSRYTQQVNSVRQWEQQKLSEVQSKAQQMFDERREELTNSLASIRSFSEASQREFDIWADAMVASVQRITGTNTDSFAPSSVQTASLGIAAGFGGSGAPTTTVVQPINQNNINIPVHAASPAQIRQQADRGLQHKLRGGLR